MSTLLNFSFFFFGLFIFSFLLWRKLKDDYTTERIFAFTWVIIFAGILGWALGNLTGNLYFWPTILLSSLTGLWYIKKFQLRLFEVIDGVAIAWLWFLVIRAIDTIVIESSGRYIATASLAISLLAVLIFSFLNRHYRGFPWYPSGKVGFPGLATLGIYFFLRSIAIHLGSMLSFLHSGTASNNLSIGEITDIVASFFVFLILTTTAYLRSGRKFAEKLTSWHK